MHTRPRLNQVWRGRGKPQMQIARSALCKPIQLSLTGYATALQISLCNHYEHRQRKIFIIEGPRLNWLPVECKQLAGASCFQKNPLGSHWSRSQMSHLPQRF